MYVDSVSYGWMTIADSHFHFIIIMSFSANNLHTYDGVSSTDIIGADVFFEIIEPEELGYTYRIRPAKDFGVPLVSSQRNIFKTQE